VSLFIVAFTVLAALSLLNLAVATTLLRQLRAPAAPGTLPAPGFSTAHLVGRRLAASSLATLAPDGPLDIIAFFSPGCPACHAQARTVAALARDGARVAALIAHAEQTADDRLRDLLDGVPVRTGPSADAIVDELGVSVFPTFLRLTDDREISAASFVVGDLLAAPHHVAL
jgi:hypothetical protein